MDFSRKWADIPPKVKCAATEAFAVPSYIHQQLIPSQNISIHKFINFPLPKPTAVVQTIVISQYFSHYDPESITEQLLERMRWLSMPTSIVVKNLVRIRHQACMTHSFGKHV
jgi:hypothetical protein